MNSASAQSLQISAGSALLIGLVVVTMLAIVVWSWTYQYRMEQRRRQASATRRTAEQYQTQILNQLPVAIFSFQPGRGFLTVSEGTSRILPINARDLIDNAASFLDIIGSENHCQFRWLAGQEECPAIFHWIGPLTTQSNTSEKKWVQVHANRDIDALGNPIIIGMIIDVSDVKQAEEALASSREELRRLAAHRENERERENHRLAREFHDELGQLLTSARLRLRLLQYPPDTIGARTVSEIDQIIVDAYRSVKAIAADLRPPALNLGLTAAIEWQAERTLLPAGVGYTIAIQPESETISDMSMTTLFRIVQEAFTNTVRYANAKHMHVSLRAVSDTVQLEVTDDGDGFSPTSIDGRQHFGLSGIRERVIALCGNFEIDSAPKEGTRIYVALPKQLKEPA